MAMTSRYGNIEIEVTVTRKELLERLKANRNKHAQEFDAAIAEWQKDLKSALSEIEPDKHTKWPEILERLEYARPESHVHEYDQAIDMFEMSVNDTIKLDSNSFNTFCRDEWGWKEDSSSNHYFQKVRGAG